MTSQRGSLEKRLTRLEYRRREREFEDLAGELEHYEELTEAQITVILGRLTRLFDGERRAGVSLEASLEKLPEAFKEAVYEDLRREFAQEGP